MYLENYERYLGTGECDTLGRDLKTFLESYNPKLYDTPANTVDNLIFTYIEKDGVRSLGKLLLIKRGNHPSIGWWALPGGFVDFNENLDIAAARELEEETGIKGLKAIQLGTYGDYDRDPRTRIITTAYVSLVKEDTLEAKAGDDASDAAWFSVDVQKLEERECQENVKEELFLLTLSCNAHGASAKVLKITDKSDILTKTDYKVAERDKISGDHPAIILHAIDYISERM